MSYDNVKIDVDGALNARLALYIKESSAELRDNRHPLVLICPGGGYAFVSAREGEPIAAQFLAAGCHAAVLWYDALGEKLGSENAPDFTHPLPIKELAWAISYIRENADKYNVESDKIIVAGFSAGGHLAASLGCFWDKEWLSKAVGKESNLLKPNGLILSYPVITSGEFAHRGSFDVLMGDKASDELTELLSLENQVTSAVPPVFMWHTFEDDCVPLENSLMFACALRKAGVNLEYHIFPHGGHGLSLATEETCPPNCDTTQPQCAQWMPLCKNWIKYNF